MTTARYRDVVGYRWDVLDRARRKTGELARVAPGAKLEWNVYADRGCVGSLRVYDHPSNPTHWHDVLLRPVALFADGGERALATMLVDAPTRTHSHASPVTPLTLRDLTARIEGFIDGSYRTVFAPDNIFEVVRRFISWADPNDAQVSLPAQDRILQSETIWDPDVNMLTSVNELLALAGCYALDVSGDGVYRSNTYYLPSERGTWFRFAPGLQARHMAEVEETTDAYDAYNSVVVIGKAPDSDSRSPSVKVINDDPADPASRVNRGYIRARVERLDSEDEAVLTAHANKLLDEERRHTRNFQFQCMPVFSDHHFLPMHSALELQTTTGVDVRGTLIRKALTLDPGERVTVQVREVPRG